jgi:hypothetical protein
LTSAKFHDHNPGAIRSYQIYEAVMTCVPNPVDRLVRAVKKLPAQFFKPLPDEVILHWLEGTYSSGIAPSVAYDQLGWALMVRGFYRYLVQDTDASGAATTPSHRGYSVIDLVDGELQCHGIRVYSSEEWKPLDAYEHPLLWKSDASSIRKSPTRHKATITCAYRLLFTDAWHGKTHIAKAFHDLWGPKKGKPKFDRCVRCDRRERAREQALAIAYLSTDFQRDWNCVNDFVKNNKAASPDKAGEYIGGFSMDASVPAGGRSVKLSGKYLSVGKKVPAKITFERIDHQVL